jgi:cytochrome b561
MKLIPQQRNSKEKITFCMGVHIFYYFKEEADRVTNFGSNWTTHLAQMHGSCGILVMYGVLERI